MPMNTKVSSDGLKRLEREHTGAGHPFDDPFPRKLRRQQHQVLVDVLCELQQLGDEGR